MRNREPAVYILTNKRNGTLYIGVTSDLPGRIWQHKNAEADGFAKQNAADRLVYYESHSDMVSAIQREKRMKKWRRKWKLELIESMNPDWRDLYDTIL